MIVRSPCPVLALPGPLFPMTQAILAFDGSPKSREALYVATYLVHGFPELKLTVITCGADAGAVLEELAEATTYLKNHGIAADAIASERTDVGSVVREVAETVDADLIVMGGYGRTPVVEIMLGSTVNEVLQTTRRPTLICQ